MTTLETVLLVVVLCTAVIAIAAIQLSRRYPALRPWATPVFIGELAIIAVAFALRWIASVAGQVALIPPVLREDALGHAESLPALVLVLGGFLSAGTVALLAAYYWERWRTRHWPGDDRLLVRTLRMYSRVAVAAWIVGLLLHLLVRGWP